MQKGHLLSWCKLFLFIFYLELYIIVDRSMAFDHKTSHSCRTIESDLYVCTCTKILRIVYFYRLWTSILIGYHRLMRSTCTLATRLIRRIVPKSMWIRCDVAKDCTSKSCWSNTLKNNELFRKINRRTLMMLTSRKFKYSIFIENFIEFSLSFLFSS